MLDSAEGNLVFDSTIIAHIVIFYVQRLDMKRHYYLYYTAQLFICLAVITFDDTKLWKEDHNYLGLEALRNFCAIFTHYRNSFYIQHVYVRLIT